MRLPVLTLGSLNGIETGVRQLRRLEPLETEVVERLGQIKVPTKAEIVRIKAFLILSRNATRDYIDFAALGYHMGAFELSQSLQSLDRLYPQKSGESPLQQLLVQLVSPQPHDLEETETHLYRGLRNTLDDWDKVAGQCCILSQQVFEHLVLEEPEQERLSNRSPVFPHQEEDCPTPEPKPPRYTDDDPMIG